MTISYMAKQYAAKRSRSKANRQSRKRSERADKWIHSLREKEPAEHQRSGNAIQEKIVPFERVAKDGRKDNAHQRNTVESALRLRRQIIVAWACIRKCSRIRHLIFLYVRHILALLRQLPSLHQWHRPDWDRVASWASDSVPRCVEVPGGRSDTHFAQPELLDLAVFRLR